MKNIKKKKRLELRITAGFLKHKEIACPPGRIRPMTAKVKQALFNIIGECSEYSLLDLFSGSGNIAIEAYSRGLKYADLVESDWGKREVILKNLKEVGFEGATLYIQDALKYCEKCTKKYDFIMVDPPFKWEKKEELIYIIGEKKLLTDNGFLVLHVYKKEKLNEKIGNLICYDKRIYGINALLFYRYNRSL